VSHRDAGAGQSGARGRPGPHPRRRLDAPVKAEDKQRPEEQTFHEFASAYMAGRKGELRESTHRD
jgi:hypothetical protein